MSSNKYDRQLRLWGASGQKALSETTIVLIHATAAGTETCKNLVLPGVGRLVVVDENAHNGDYASNFFVVNSNKPRAEAVLEHLLELNPDVVGTYESVERLSDVDYKALLSSKSQMSSGTTIVVASDLEPPILLSVARTCDALQLSLLAVESYGLIGLVRVQSPPLPRWDPKPRSAPPDLRLVQPFAALESLANSIEWETLDSVQHAHVPYPLILLRMMGEWKRQHNNALPQTFAEKQAFAKSIRDAAGNWDHELNFQEAQQYAYLAYTQSTVDVDHLRELAATAQSSCPNLCAAIQALLQFVEANGQGPVYGTIPDCVASSELYVQLQNIYRTKAQEDYEFVRARVPHNLLDDEQVRLVCQNARLLSLYQPRSIVEEIQEGVVDNEQAQELQMALDDACDEDDGMRLEQSPLLWYLGVVACRVFYEKYGRYPGTRMMQQDGVDDYLSDVPLLQTCLAAVLQHYHVSLPNPNGDNDKLQQLQTKIATELTRYANAEIHSIASIVGGVASQEVVKIVTGQYTPIDNCYVFQGITGTGGVYRV